MCRLNTSKYISEAHAKGVHFFTTIEPRNSEFNFAIELVRTLSRRQTTFLSHISSNLLTTRNNSSCPLKTRKITV
jgi:hypothetical protein